MALLIIPASVGEETGSEGGNWAGVRPHGPSPESLSSLCSFLCVLPGVEGWHCLHGSEDPGARLLGTWGLAEAPALAESRPWASRAASLALPVQTHCQALRWEALKCPLLAELGVRLSVPGGGGALSPGGLFPALMSSLELLNPFLFVYR